MLTFLSVTEPRNKQRLLEEVNLQFYMKTYLCSLFSSPLTAAAHGFTEVRVESKLWFGASACVTRQITKIQHEKLKVYHLNACLSYYNIHLCLCWEGEYL